MMQKTTTKLLALKPASSLTFFIGLSVGSLLSVMMYHSCSINPRKSILMTSASLPVSINDRPSQILSSASDGRLDEYNTASFKRAMSSLQTERHTVLWNHCKTRSKQFKGFSNSSNPNAMHSTRYKYSVCDIQKCGSTSWQSFTLVAENYFTAADYTERRIEGKKVLNLVSNALRLGSTRYRIIGKRLWADSMKIITVRDPFERIVSAYKNKMRRDGGGFTNFYGNISEHINRSFRKMRQNVTERKMADDGAATFEDFVNFLLYSKDDKVYDQHWSTYDGICHPCWFKYDYIMKFETLQEDKNYLKTILNITEEHKNIFFVQTAFQTQLDLVKKHFAAIPCEASEKLYEKYQKDFDAFGYERPKWLC